MTMIKSGCLLGDRRLKTEDRRRKTGDGVGSRKTEDGRLESEVGRRKTEDWSRKSEVGRRKTEVGSRKSEDGRRKSEVEVSRRAQIVIPVASASVPLVTKNFVVKANRVLAKKS